MQKGFAPGPLLLLLLLLQEGIASAPQLTRRQGNRPMQAVNEGSHLLLQEVIASDPQLCQGKGHMLVFTRDVASANATARALQGEVGAPVLLFHRDRPQVGGFPSCWV